MFLPCSPWVASLPPWRTAGDASPPQTEDYLAAIPHPEKQDLQKKINTCKKHVWICRRTSKHCSVFPHTVMYYSSSSPTTFQLHIFKAVQPLKLSQTHFRHSFPQFTILCLIIFSLTCLSVCDPEIDLRNSRRIPKKQPQGAKNKDAQEYPWRLLSTHDI